MSTLGTIRRRTLLTGVNNPAFQVSLTVANDSFIVSSAAADGAVAVRDSAQADGWGFTGAGAAGTVLVGGAAPAFSAAPSLTSMALSSFVAVGATPAAAGSVRVPNSTAVNWRNQGNTADLGLSLNAANAFDLSASLAVAGNMQVASGNVIGWSGLARLVGTLDGRLQVYNNALTSGVGIDVTTNAVLKVRTTAHSAYATVDALAYQASGAAGVNFGPAHPASITIVGGIVTACS